MGGKGDSLEIVQEIQIWSYKKWYIYTPEFVFKNDLQKKKNPSDFDIYTNDSRPDGQTLF